MIVAVDLAALRSAVCVMSSGQVVEAQFSSYGIAPGAFVRRVAEECFVAWISDQTDPLYVVVEDLPFHLPPTSITKQVARLQGQLALRLHDWKLCDRLWFVPPALWQRATPGVWRQAEKGAQAAALSYGYRPPDLLTERAEDYAELVGKDRQRVRAALKKSMTDHVDAFLIALWATRSLDSDFFREDSPYRYICCED